MIGIIDYGMGNIHSVNKALESMDVKTLVTNKRGDLKQCDKLVLPGVGAFKDAMAELEKQGLSSAIVEYIRTGKVFLGICLGMQLLFDSSQEAEGVKGLGVIRGEVKKFSLPKGFKVPQMGWNQLKADPQCPLLKGLDKSPYVYFCHSYYAVPADKKAIAATTDYAGDFASVVWRDNVYGMQFHPEKSQDVGLQILRNFVKI